MPGVIALVCHRERSFLRRRSQTHSTRRVALSFRASPTHCPTAEAKVSQARLLSHRMAPARTPSCGFCHRRNENGMTAPDGVKSEGSSWAGRITPVSYMSSWNQALICRNFFISNWLFVIFYLPLSHPPAIW